MKTKEFLSGYRTFIFFGVLTLFQGWFMFKDLAVGSDTFAWWIAGGAAFIGANKVNKVLNAKKDIAASLTGNEK